VPASAQCEQVEFRTAIYQSIDVLRFQPGNPTRYPKQSRAELASPLNVNHVQGFTSEGRFAKQIGECWGPWKISILGARRFWRWLAPRVGLA
jgi:hypothetical protein